MRLDDDVDRATFVVGRAVDADRPTKFAHVRAVFGLDLHDLTEHTLEHVSRITETERVPGQYESVSESIEIRLKNRSGEDTVGPIEIDLADRSCLQIGGVEPSVGAGDEAET